MIYPDKYFPQDKNTILRAAQGFVEPQLLQRWAEIGLECYMQAENPLGLVDDFVQELQNVDPYDTSLLQELYEILSAIYRMRHGSNQLEFIWDGRSHYEVYAENWSLTFESWVRQFCAKPEVYRAVIKACILQQPTNHKFLYYAIRKVILDHFQVKVTRTKQIKAA